MRFFKRLLRRRSKEPPEMYWVRRGERVLGAGGLEEQLEGQQVDTFRTIWSEIRDRRYTDVVDVGCNVAALGQLIFQWGYRGRYVGVGNNPHALRFASVELARTPGRWRLVNGNARALPFRERGHQAVVVKDVLEHLEDFRPALGEAARVARRAIIVSSFIPWGRGRPSIRRHRRGFYLNRYRRRDILEFLAGRGFHPQADIPTQEKDGNPNEVVVFVRLA